ncbi:MAG: GDCCVxC domain-containing (seleno)protein [Bacteroidia bacterium]
MNLVSKLKAAKIYYLYSMRLSTLYSFLSCASLLLCFQSCSHSSANEKKVTLNQAYVQEKEIPAWDSASHSTIVTDPTRSNITCPACGNTETKTLPTDVCLIKYTCPRCKTDIYPKEGDCCVFCSYGTVKCPSKQ